MPKSLDQAHTTPLLADPRRDQRLWSIVKFLIFSPFPCVDKEIFSVGWKLVNYGRPPIDLASVGATVCATPFPIARASQVTGGRAEDALCAGIVGSTGTVRGPALPARSTIAQ